MEASSRPILSSMDFPLESKLSAKSANGLLLDFLAGMSTIAQE